MRKSVITNRPTRPDQMGAPPFCRHTLTRSLVRHGCLLAFAVATLLLAGCGGSGPNLVQIEGTVSLDGKPLANKSLLFTPIEGTEGQGAGGTTNAEGKYTVSAMIPGATQDYPGIGPGRYRVTVFAATVVDAIQGAPSDEPEVAIAPGAGSTSDIPGIYGTDRSPLIIDVPDSDGQVNLELSSNPGV